MFRRLLFVVCVCSLTVDSFAEAPDVTAVFPAGGQRGTDVTIHAIDSKGARRGRGGGRRRKEEAPAKEKADPASIRLWSNVPGIELIEPEGQDNFKLKLAADVPAGTAWLRLYNDDGASALKPFVIGQSRELSEAEPNDSLGQATAVGELPAVANGVLEKSGEVDTFRVSLKAGKTLVAVLAAKQSLGSPMDAILQVTDSSGFVLEQNDDRRGFDPQLAVTVPKDGDYFIRVFAFPAAPDTNVQFSGAPTYVYRLTLTDGPLMDRVLPTAATAGQPAKARPFGWNLADGVGEIELPPQPAGVRSIFHDGWESTAKVLVTPQPAIVEQEPNSLAQPQMVAVPGVLCGVIGEAKDVDAWKFSAKTGQRLSLRLAATNLGSALDAVVRIYDSEGKKTAEVDDAPQDEADVVLEFTAPKDGDYVVSVTDRFAHGGPAYWYALSAAEPQMKAVLQVAADAFAVKAETPLEIPVTIDRRLGYALPLKVAVEGLPEGVTADVVVSEPTGDSSKSVKLVVKSTRVERWVGPIRIVGKAEGDAIPEYAAHVKSPANDEWLPHLWLTALPK